jgi:hypothetical protein
MALAFNKPSELRQLNPRHTRALSDSERVGVLRAPRRRRDPHV